MVWKVEPQLEAGSAKDKRQKIPGESLSEEREFSDRRETSGRTKKDSCTAIFEGKVIQQQCQQ
eukprot:scaffold129058_cov67-Cyclotella_meneghiniana.AAC.3